MCFCPNRSTSYLSLCLSLNSFSDEKEPELHYVLKPGMQSQLENSVGSGRVWVLAHGFESQSVQWFQEHWTRGALSPFQPQLLPGEATPETQTALHEGPRPGWRATFLPSPLESSSYLQGSRPVAQPFTGPSTSSPSRVACKI